MEERLATPTATRLAADLDAPVTRDDEPRVHVVAVGGRTIIDGEKGQTLENVRLGVTAALSLSRRRSLKLYGSTTDNDFWSSTP